ncbi:DNA ligase 1-like [Nasonia vitripennis]|uniref:Uncharacterized protein n=1 Tax=Nasonia vitripennis TaxID=7425 RepID=A0A7M7QJ97_NASVI|nr:DNA ligase 1-like [Nasonia vitripennis]
MQKKLEKYLSLVVTKLDDNSNPDNVLKTTEKVSKENSQASLTEDEKDKFSESKVVEAANFEEDETEVEENKSADTEVKDVVARSVQDEKKVDKKQTSCSKLDHDANEKVPESQKENEARLKKKPKTSKVKIISDIKIPSRKELESQSKELEKKSKQILWLEQKIKKLRIENQDLLKNNAQLLEKNRSLKKEVTKYVSLNTDLQKQVVEKMKEFHGCRFKLQNSWRTLQYQRQ